MTRIKAKATGISESAGCILNLDYEQLYALADAHNAEFKSAEPFPHVAIDNLFDAVTYRQIADAFPASDSAIWKKPENAHTQGKLVTRRGERNLKEAFYDAAARAVFFELNSGLFLYFLERLTNIQGLMGDPYFAEAGFHCTEPGGRLDIHADFSHHDQIGLERRLNLIYYLNEDWNPEYCGALKLYDRELQPRKEFMPIANRCVIFATSETSFHGHPEPITAPPGTYRKSIALYYYTVPTGRRKTKIIFPEDPYFTFKVSEEQPT
jgi:hypothetical protein